MHVEDVVRADRRGAGQAIGLGSVGRVGGESERRAAACRTVQLQEEEVVPSRQDPDPVARDVLVADGAPHSVEQRAEAILRTHPAGV